MIDPQKLTVVCLFAICSLLAAQSTVPERTVHGNVITSDRDPKARISLPQEAYYLGADRWVLYGNADCELHAFVEADAGRNVKKLYWVQFEQYLPSKPDLHHTYDSPRHALIGGLDFYVDTWVRSRTAAIEAGSDREHIEQLIRANGYTMPYGMMYVRFVHLLDKEKRQELMIIYGEDLTPIGLSAAELGEGGKARARWPEIDKSLIERAKQKITVEDIK